VRFKYILKSTSSHKLTKTKGVDNFSYFATSLTDYKQTKEVQFSNYDSQIHSYILGEQLIDTRHFENETAFMGPMLLASNDETSILFAYEHGSQYDNPFVNFKLNKDRQVTLSALKGNYVDKQPLSLGNDYETLWFEVAGVKGTEDQLADLYRTFILKDISLYTESREPYIYYNTWGRQERVKWSGGNYRQSMNLKQTLAEIEKSHAMGVDVFVLDVGWFTKTGDWQLNTDAKFFPDTLSQVKSLLKKYDMKLGLWFNPTLAGITSNIAAANISCRTSLDGKLQNTYPSWETEDSYSMCLASDYWVAYSKELIRLIKEHDVVYFKWDAIWQGDCDAPGHFHGTDENTRQDRRDYDAFLQPVYMAKIVEMVSAIYPKTIFDFDITEESRSMGLSFIAVGKYFAINNGSYYHNYNLAKAPRETGYPNVFVRPGAARPWIMRSILTYDKWIPSILFLTHYQSDGSKNSQLINIASLILGQNGVWGDILKDSTETTQNFGSMLAKYKQVKNDITVASPVTVGKPSELVEVYEKINPANGKGAVVLFNVGNKPIHYITKNKLNPKMWTTENVKVTFDAEGRAVIDATFTETSAKILLFGVE